MPNRSSVRVTDRVTQSEPRCACLLALVLCLLMSVGVVAAPVVPPTGEPETPPATSPEPDDDANPIVSAPAPVPEESIEERKARITAALEAITVDGEVSAVDQPTAAAYQNALASIEAADEAIRRRNEKLALIESAPADLAALQEQLASASTPRSLPVLDEEAVSLDELRSLQTELAGESAVRTRDRDAVRSLRSERSTFIAEIPKELATLRTTLEAWTTTDAEASPMTTDGASPEAARAERLAAQTSLRERIAALETEQRFIRARSEVMDVRVQLREELLKATQAAQKRVIDEIAAREQRAVEAEIKAAKQAELDARNSHPLIQEILARATRDSNAKKKAVTDQAELAEAIVDREANLNQWENIRASTVERIEELGLDRRLGGRLRTLRRRLPPEREIRRLIDDLEDQLNDTYALRGELDDRARELESVVDIAEEQLAAYEEANPAVSGDRAKLKASMIELLEAEAKTVGEVRSELGEVEDELSSRLSLERQYRRVVSDFRTLIDEQILWIRSDDPLGPQDLRNAYSDLKSLASKASVERFAGGMVLTLTSQPVAIGLGLIGVLVLFILRRPAARKLESCAQAARRPAHNGFAPTVIAVGMTMVMIAFWPVFALFLSWFFSQSSAQSDLGVVVAAAFSRASYALLIGLMLWQLWRPNGLALAHFRWEESTGTRLRRHLRWVIPIAVPSIAIVAGFRRLEEKDGAIAIAQVAFVVVMLAVAFFTWRVMNPARGIPRRYIEQNRDGWIDRLSFIWYFAITAIPVVFAVVAAIGWFYTAIELEQRIVQVLLILVIAVIAQALLMRWLMVAQRRVALEQARRKREAMLAEMRRKAEEAAAGGDAVGESGESVKEKVAVIDESDLDVKAISVRANKLVRTAIAVGIFIFMVITWADVLPAFGRLDSIKIGAPQALVVGATSTEESASSSSPDITSTFTGGSTSGEAEAAESASPESTTVSDGRVSLGDILRSIAILIGTLILARDLPGLLEITIITRLPITPGSRYAITTIMRYVIVIVGVVWAFNTIGIGWSKVQFLAAAVTVGLGFGLQEIFANFVSGIILLFERPIRVGDTVTVNGVSGTVSRIRMRATTIIDWDRKELIVPNRSFVTGDIVNWSLSDSVLRIAIDVGLAYGSDVTHARKRMLEIASSASYVMKDPAPRAFFVEFGDSVLLVRLFIFTNDPDNRLIARHEVCTLISDAFTEEGIEIAFPQRDLHLRSVDREAFGGLPGIPESDVGPEEEGQA